MNISFKNQIIGFRWHTVFSFFALVLVLGGCNKDDEVDLAVAIIGTWLEAGYEYRNCDDPSDNETYVNEECSTNGTYCWPITFYADGRFYFEDSEYPDLSYEKNYRIIGNKLIIEGEAIISISDNVLTLTYQGNNGCTVIERYRRQ